MTYTILSGQFANEDGTAAILMTAEAAAVLISAVDTPDLWAEMLAWGTPQAYAVPNPVPASVSRAQAKIALSRNGLLASVEQAVAAAGREVAIWFADALTWRRDNPNILSLGASLNLTPDQIDDLFRQAAQIDG